jgi:Fe-S cluster assembly protein SufD
MTTITANTFTDRITESFAATRKELFGDAAVREKAMESFLRLGVPGRKSEEYKYVNVELALKDLNVGAQPVSKPSTFEAAVVPAEIRIAIVNGAYSPELSDISSLPEGLSITDISVTASDASFNKYYNTLLDNDNDPFAALNTALATGGVFIHVSRGASVTRPIHIVSFTSADAPTLFTSRNLVVLDENAELTVIESFVSAGTVKCFHNAATELVVGASSRLKHYKIQDEGENGYLLNTTHACQGNSSVFTTNNFTLSGSFVRNNLTIVLDGEHIESNLNGLYLTNGNQVVDNHTLVDHRKPNCNSNELYKGIIEGKSSATFNGKIFVRKDAQKTNAFQSNKNILLSDDGTINTKPQLEIYADDVKCSHGTSTGKLDEDKIFYLRARGLSQESARNLLMHAFASEVVEHIGIDELRDFVEQKIAARFL